MHVTYRASCKKEYFKLDSKLVYQKPKLMVNGFAQHKSEILMPSKNHRLVPNMACRPVAHLKERKVCGCRIVSSGASQCHEQDTMLAARLYLLTLLYCRLTLLDQVFWQSVSAQDKEKARLQSHVQAKHPR